MLLENFRISAEIARMSYRVRRVPEARFSKVPARVIRSFWASPGRVLEAFSHSLSNKILMLLLWQQHRSSSRYSSILNCSLCCVAVSSLSRVGRGCVRLCDVLTVGHVDSLAGKQHL